MAQAVSFSHSLGPKPTNFVACGWSGIGGNPDSATAIRRPPLVLLGNAAAVWIVPFIGLNGGMGTTQGR
jgi:hypothetical protein